MQFFSSDKRLQEIFFQNHPPPPPPSRVKWSAPKISSKKYLWPVQTETRENKPKLPVERNLAIMLFTGCRMSDRHLTRSFESVNGRGL